MFSIVSVLAVQYFSFLKIQVSFRFWDKMAHFSWFSPLNVITQPGSSSIGHHKGLWKVERQRQTG